MAVLFLLSMGILMQYSAAGGEFRPWAIKQVTYLLISIAIAQLALNLPLSWWYNLAYPAYFIALGLLIMVMVMGHNAMGATRWLNLGFFKLQPAEIMKLCTILALSQFFTNLNIHQINKPINLVTAFAIIGLPFLLIAAQPDLGTALIIVALGLVIMFIAGVSRWLFIGLIVFAMISGPILWSQLHDYQRKRVLTFIDPTSDPLGAGYNIIQSKIAIGSGGWAGQGLMQGSQSQLSYLPEHHTDFVFTPSLQAPAHKAAKLRAARCT
ncbi:MAG: FtsW/RodA/SpoVE family cell cycle protein, partial [Pseudomonadota bacterium]